MRAAPPVQSRYGPTLPELLAPRLRRVPPVLRVGVPALIAAIALLAVAYKVFKGPAGHQVVVRDPITFNFRFQSPLHEVPARPGELVRLEAHRHDAQRTFLSSFTIRPLRLPAYRGQVGALLPAYATTFERSLARRFASLEIVQEGRQRVVNEVAYAIFFTARLGKRHLSGRDILLPGPKPGSRDGVELEFLATPAGGAGLPALVGNTEPLATPLHTFRFGTSGP